MGVAPPWLRVALAGLVIAIACGSGLRLGASLRRGRQAEPDADGLHVLMGIAMAGMLEPRLSVLPAVAWPVAFAASAAWFGWKSLLASRAPAGAVSRYGVPLPHFIESLAMIYMLLAGTAAAPGMIMAGIPPARLSGLSEIVALLLALSMAGYAIWAAGSWTTLRLTAGYRIAMSITMGYMLIQMA